MWVGVFMATCYPLFLQAWYVYLVNAVSIYVNDRNIAISSSAHHFFSIHNLINFVAGMIVHKKYRNPQEMKRFRADDDGKGRGKSDVPSYADAVRAGQRSSPNFKNAWHQFCDSEGQPVYDPAKQSPEFLQQFFDRLGVFFLKATGQEPIEHNIRSSGKGNGRQSQNNLQLQNANHSARRGSQMSGYVSPRNDHSPRGTGQHNNDYHNGRNSEVNLNPPTSTAQALGQVVELIKLGQRNSRDWKTSWIQWCQQNGGGVHDPTRHDSMFIIAFVLKYGLADVVQAKWARNHLIALGELAKPCMV